MVWYGRVWSGMIWSGMVGYGAALDANLVNWNKELAAAGVVAFYQVDAYSPTVAAIHSHHRFSFFGFSQLDGARWC